MAKNFFMQDILLYEQITPDSHFAQDLLQEL